MDKQTIRLIRDGERGLALVLYLDTSSQLLDEWMEHEGWQVASIQAELSERLLTWLIEQVEGVTPIRDEASRAIALFLDAGLNRQAWASPLIEGLLSTKPDDAKPDPFDGYAESVQTERSRWRSWVGFPEQPRHLTCGRCHADAERESAERDEDLAGDPETHHRRIRERRAEQWLRDAWERGGESDEHDG